MTTVLLTQNKLGDTPLHSAAWKNHPLCVRMLLDKGTVLLLLSTLLA